MHYMLGEALAGQKRWDGAIAEYHQAMNIEEDWRGHEGLGEALEGKGDLDGAIAEYRLALQTYQPFLMPDGQEDFWREYDLFTKSDLHFRIGHLLSSKDDASGAVKEIQEAIRLSPSAAPYHEFLGQLLEETADFTSALAEYRTAQELDPNYSEARQDFARLKKSQDLIMKAREEVQRHPEDAASHEMLARGLSLINDDDDAIAQWRDVLRLHPSPEEEVNAHLSLCRTFEKRFELLDKALAECREAVRLGPHCDLCHQELAEQLWITGDVDGAIEHYQEAIRLVPDSWRSHRLGEMLTERGNSLAWEGDWKGAAREYREAIRVSPADGESHHGLGVALESQGDRESALGEYRKACDFDSTNPTFQSDYARLMKELSK